MDLLTQTVLETQEKNFPLHTVLQQTSYRFRCHNKQKTIGNIQNEVLKQNAWGLKLKKDRMHVEFVPLNKQYAQYGHANFSFNIFTESTKADWISKWLLVLSFELGLKISDRNKRNENQRAVKFTTALTQTFNCVFPVKRELCKDDDGSVQKRHLKDNSSVFHEFRDQL